MGARRRIQRVSAVVAVVALGWALRLALGNGVDANVFGVHLASHDPLRVLWVGIAAASVWIWSRGAGLTFQQWQAVSARINARTAAYAAAALIVAIGAVYGTKSGTGSDSYGYVSEADFWLAGGRPIAQPWVKDVPWPDADWTFAPLGYRPAATTKEPTIIPTYSAGLPFLFAAAKRLAGHCAMFLVVPLLGGVLVLATYGIGRRLGSPVAGAIAACFVAASPIVLYMVPLPMSDIPVAASWTAAIFFLFGEGIGSATGAGLATALAIAIRPNLAPAAVVLASWYLVDRRRIARAIAFGACAALGVVAVAFVNRQLFGSFTTSGYGQLSEQFMLANIPVNTKLYLRWLVESQTWLSVVGVVAALLPLRWFWPDVVDRRRLWIIASFVLVVSIEYMSYLVFDSWMYLRFLLPIWPFLMLGLASTALRLMRMNSPALAIVTVVVIASLGVSRYLEGVRRGALVQWIDAQRDAGIAATVGAAIDPNSVVLSMIHGGTMRFYGGRMTLRYDNLPVDWLDRAVVWLNDHGAHPYLLVADWEVVKIRERFQGARTLERLASPIATFERSSTQLFDLADGEERRRIRSDPPLRCLEPVPPPAFRLSR